MATTNNKNEEKIQNKEKQLLLNPNDFSIIGIEVPSYSEKYVGSKSVTFYAVEVTSRITKNTWKIEKRYSELSLV